MVHQQFDALAVGIVVEHLDVEVGIRCHEVEDIALPHVGPVFPTNIPTLDQHLVETILGSKVDVSLHILIVGLMGAVGLHLRPVNLVELDAGEVVGIVPRATTHNHFPPHATILGRMNPRGIVKGAGFVEVQDEIAGQHVTGIVADHDCTPRCLARCLHTTLQTRSVGCQMTDKGERLWQGEGRGCRIGGIGIAASAQLGGQLLGIGINQFQMHGGIVQTSSFVDVDIQSVVALHLQRGLHTRG